MTVTEFDARFDAQPDNPIRAIGDLGADLGHEVTVVRDPDGKRFRLACSCGWLTRRNWTRKATFQAAQDHLYEVIKASRVS